MSNYRKTMTEALREMYPLNEGTIDKVKEIASKKQAMKIDGVMVDSFTASAISQIYDKVNDANKKKMDKLPITKLANLAFKMMKKEEVDLDEGKMKDLVIKGQDLEMYAKKSGGIDKNDMMKVAAMLKKGNKSGAVKYAMKLDTDPKEYILNLIGEETELDEGKMQDVWQKKNAKSLSVGPFELIRGKGGVSTIKRSGKVIGDFSLDRDADNFVANIKGMRGQWVGDDIDSLFTHLQKVHSEEVDLDEASARADARRSMRADPDMRQKFSKDVSATDDDIKGASKNIMMQMRKAQSLNGRFDVEFADGKKVKIPAKMAIAVQQKYNSMKRPAEKEKFQAKVGKSYRDMLSALKEAVSPAQQAAIAISKKERGEKPKKESVLDRIDKKIKEKNDG